MLSIFSKHNLLTEGFIRNIRDNTRVVGSTLKALSPMAMTLVPAALLGLGSLATFGNSANYTNSLVSGENYDKNDDSLMGKFRNAVSGGRATYEGETDRHVYDARTGKTFIIKKGDDDINSVQDCGTSRLNLR